MKKSTASIVIVAVIIIAGIMGALVGYYWMSESRQEPRGDVDPSRVRSIVERERDSFYTYLIIKSITTTINMALAAILIGLYYSLYREVKSEFTFSLIIVMFALLIYAITSNPFIPRIFGFGGIGLGPFMIIPDLFATVALLTLLYISLK